MAYLRLDDLFPERPDVVGLSDRAFRVHTRAIFYAARHRTGGAIPTPAYRAIHATPRIRRELVDAGAWADDGTGVLTVLG